MCLPTRGTEDDVHGHCPFLAASGFMCSLAPSSDWLPFQSAPRNNCSVELVPLAESEEANMPESATFTIHLCKNGKEFKLLPNVVERDGVPRPRAGETMDTGEGTWKII